MRKNGRPQVNKFFSRKNREYTETYYRWRVAVLKRDKKCKMPGCNKCDKLQVHHIIKWADNYALRFAERNGIALCVQHHKMIKGKEECYIPLFMTLVRQAYENNS
jgi:hypothetical protein